MFEEKELTVIQLFTGLTIINKFEDILTDPVKGIEFAAIYICPDDILKKARINKLLLNPYIEQVELMKSEEVTKIISFFSAQSMMFGRDLQPKDLNKKK